MPLFTGERTPTLLCNGHKGQRKTQGGGPEGTCPSRKLVLSFPQGTTTLSSQVYAGSISASPGQRSKSLLWVKRCPNWQSGSPNPGLKGPRPRPMPPQQPCQVYKAPPCTLRGWAGECHRPLIRTPHPLSVSLRTSFPLRPTEGSLCSLRETANRPVGESSFKIKSVAAGSLTLSSCPF